MDGEPLPIQGHGRAEPSAPASLAEPDDTALTPEARAHTDRYAHWRVWALENEHRFGLEGLREYQVDALMRTMSDCGMEPPLPELEEMTPTQLYVWLRQMIDLHRATWRRIPVVDIAPHPRIAGVLHRAFDDAMVITYDAIDYRVITPRGGSGMGEAEVFDTTALAPEHAAARLRYMRDGISLLAHNTWPYLRWHLRGIFGDPTL